MHQLLQLNNLSDGPTSQLIVVAVIAFALCLLILYFLLVRSRSRVNAKKLEKQSEVVEAQAALILEKKNQLEDQNKRLTELNEEKNNLISIVSHDLKSPFNRIFALVNLLQMDSDNYTIDQANYLIKINTVVKDGLDLVRNLLDIRALEYKGIQTKIEKINFNETIKHLISGYNSMARNKNITINYKEKSKVQAMSDKMYLNRIFDNLISNAIKYSPNGSQVEVTIDKSDKIRVSIKDNGPGIHPDEQKRLFQKFQILSARPTSGESSTGLGLSIAKSMITLLGGDIKCESELGKGATFIAEFPGN